MHRFRTVTKVPPICQVPLDAASYPACGCRAACAESLPESVAVGVSPHKVGEAVAAAIQQEARAADRGDEPVAFGNGTAFAGDPRVAHRGVKQRVSGVHVCERRGAA